MPVLALPSSTAKQLRSWRSPSNRLPQRPLTSRPPCCCSSPTWLRRCSRLPHWHGPVRWWCYHRPVPVMINTRITRHAVSTFVRSSTRYEPSPCSSLLEGSLLLDGGKEQQRRS